MTRRLFEHPLVTARAITGPRNDGGTHEFLRLEMADWVNVVPVTVEGDVVLVRQHRWGIGEDTLEIPGGLVNLGESPEEAAVRELREETGYGGGLLVTLGWVWSNPAIQTNRTFLYLAQDVGRLGDPEPDSTERIVVELHARDAVERMIRTGDIAHALAVVTLQRWLWGGAAPP